jgi:Trypsin-like peptidase domain
MRTVLPALCLSAVFLAFAPLSRAEAPPPDATTRMIQATCKVTGKDSTATSFLVRRPVAGKAGGQETILVTAAHVFERMAGDEAKLVLRKSQKDGSYARHEMPLKVRAEGKPLWSKHPETDVAALRVQLPEHVAVTPIPIACLATGSTLDAGRLAPGDDVRIACYPIQLEASGAGFPIIRRGCVASFPLTPVKVNKMYLVDYNTFAGDSGGPVFLIEPVPGEEKARAESRPVVVGLILAQHFHDERVKLAYEERLVRHRMGLGIVVHAEYIRQTIDLLK